MLGISGSMPSPLPEYSSVQEGQSAAAAGSSLYLNVYDISPINSYIHCLGLGIFHSGIEVHGMEYGYGAHDYPTSGVFEIEPKSCPGFVFRCSLWLGTTEMSRSEFRSFIEDLASKYHGDNYHLINKNCNHFTNDVSMQLIGKPIPGWVNRLARMGTLCQCVLPDSIKVTAVKESPAHTAIPDDESDSGEAIFELSNTDEPDYRLLTSTSSRELSRSRSETQRLAKDSF